MKIRTKLLTAYLGVALIPLLSLGAITYNLAERTLIAETLDNLDGIASRLTSTFRFLSEKDARIAATLLEDGAVKDLFGRTVDESAATSSTGGLDDLLQTAQRIDPRVSALMLLDVSGSVFASTDPQRLGRDLSGEDFFRQGLVASSESFYKDENGSLSLRFGAPVRDGDTLVGVFAADFIPSRRLQLIGDYTGLGRSGEIVVVKRDAGGDALIVLPTRFDANAAMTRKIASDTRDNAVARALDGFSGVFSDTLDYRGIHVLASSRYVEDLGLGIEVKIDRSEALMPMRSIALGTLGTMLLAAILILLVTMLVSGSIAGRIVALTSVTRDISLGKLDAKFVKVDANDEIGDLYRTFERILVSLKLAMRETNKSAKKPPLEKT